MDLSWITATGTAVVMVVLSAIGIYAAIILLTRLAGLRSFSKLSSFDFAVTVAFGSILAGVVLTQNPPLLQGAVALAALFGVQMAVAFARTRWTWATAAVDNPPRLLMAGPTILHDQLEKARVTEADLLAKLREANVFDLRQVRAVVMESTGDISVLHGDPDRRAELDPAVVEGVLGRERLFEDRPAAS